MYWYFFMLCCWFVGCGGKGLGGLFVEFLTHCFADEFAAICVLSFRGSFQIVDDRLREVDQQCFFAGWLFAFRGRHGKHII